jgi:hypothetical protein
VGREKPKTEILLARRATPEPTIYELILSCHIKTGKGADRLAKSPIPRLQGSAFNMLCGPIFEWGIWKKESIGEKGFENEEIPHRFTSLTQDSYSS